MFPASRLCLPGWLLSTFDGADQPLPIVLYEKDGRIARITLDPPEILNAVEADMPTEISDAVVRADAVEYQTGALRA